jgi:GH3 auxin-responsive promoter
VEAESVRSEHRRLLATLDRPEAVQSDLLVEILAVNAATDYGQLHGLPGVRTVDEYRHAVPIRTHEELMPWIERAMAGERNVLTADDPVVYFSSSGSTGREKHIPVTRTYMRKVFLPFYLASFAVLMEAMPQVLAPGGVLNLYQDPTSPTARTPGGSPHIGASQIDYRAFDAGVAVGPGNEAAWSRIPQALAGDGPWERAYYKLRLAAQQDIRLIIAVNPAILAGLAYQVREQWPRLVEEIRAGTVGGRPHGVPDPGRADEIAGYARAFGTVHPYHLWPRLSAIVAWNSALASLYLPRVRERFGPGVQLFAAPIASCEGPAAVPVDRHPSGAPLYLPGCFYEFLPADRPLHDTPDTLLAHELDEGRDYHLILSHVGGLFRCAITDVVRVIGRIGRTPRIEYAGRNTVRAGLTEAQALDAVRAALRDTGSELTNATFGPDGDIAVAGTLAPGFDAALRRRLGSKVKVIQVAPDAFLHEWERALRSGQRPPRVKDRVFMPGEGVWERIVSCRTGYRAEDGTTSRRGGTGWTGSGLGPAPR